MSAPSTCNAEGGVGKGRFRVMPPTLFVGLLALTAGIALAAPTRAIDPAPLNYLGAALVGAGIFLNLWSDQQLKRAQTTVKPFAQPTVLITNGAFRLTRNPMYLGMALILAGTAWLLGSPPALLCAAAFMLAVQRWFVRTEEANAAAVFGAAYEDYRRSVRRWL